MPDFEVIRPGFVWQFPAVVDRIVDGDTVICHVLRAPLDERHGESVRLDGINAIELSQKFGAEARDRLAALLPPGTQITMFERKREKYGRTLARIVTLQNVDVCQEMLLARATDGVTPLAVPYNP